MPNLGTYFCTIIILQIRTYRVSGSTTDTKTCVSGIYLLKNISYLVII